MLRQIDIENLLNEDLFRPGGLIFYERQYIDT